MPALGPVYVANPLGGVGQGRIGLCQLQPMDKCGLAQRKCMEHCKSWKFETTKSRGISCHDVSIRTQWQVCQWGPTMLTLPCRGVFTLPEMLCISIPCSGAGVQ
eukprot:gene8277-biopygen7609